MQPVSIMGSLESQGTRNIMRKPTKGTAGNQKTNFGRKIVLEIKQKIIVNQMKNHRPTTEA